MSTVMEDDIKRWTGKRKAALVLEILQGRTTVAESSRSFDLPPSEIEQWVEDAKKGMENALRSKPLEVREQYERQASDGLRHAAMLPANRSSCILPGPPRSRLESARCGMRPAYFLIDDR